MKLSLAALVLLTQVFGSLLCCCAPQRVDAMLSSPQRSPSASQQVDAPPRPPAKVRCAHCCSISPPIDERQSPDSVVAQLQTVPSQKSCACDRTIVTLVAPTSERPIDLLLPLFSIPCDPTWVFAHPHPSAFCTLEVPVPPPLAYLVKETQLYAHHVLRC